MTLVQPGADARPLGRSHASRMWLLVAAALLGLIAHVGTHQSHGLHGESPRAAYPTSTALTDDMAEPSFLDARPSSADLRGPLHGGTTDVVACGLILIMVAASLRHLTPANGGRSRTQHLMGHDRRGPPRNTRAPFFSPVPVSRC